MVVTSQLEHTGSKLPRTGLAAPWHVGSSQIRDQTHVSCIGRQIPYQWVTRSEVAQLCLTLCDPMDCSLSSSSVHGIFQARVLERVAISFFRGSSRPRDWTLVSRSVGRCFTLPSEPQGKPPNKTFLGSHFFFPKKEVSQGNWWNNWSHLESIWKMEIVEIQFYFPSSIYTRKLSNYIWKLMVDL